MSLKIVDTSEGILVSINGDLDHHAAKNIIKEINLIMDDYIGTTCILDMADVGFMDSSGIAVILLLHRKMEEIGGSLRVRNVTKQAMKVFDAAGLRRLVKFEI